MAYKSSIKVTTLVGTRPEIIRLSVIFAKFDQVFQHRIINANQNQNPELNKNFFEELNLIKADVELAPASTGSFAGFLGGILVGVEEELKRNRPDAFVVLGDTNTALAAIVARKMGIPVYHLEAGNRSFDINVPEETNRRIIDHFSDFNLVYTQNAKDNLIAEGLHPRSISVIGSPLREVIKEYRSVIDSSSIIKDLKLEKNGFILASFHRQENVDQISRLEEILLGISGIAKSQKLKVVVSTHPRTKAKLVEQGLLGKFDFNWHEPFGFTDYCNLQMNARIVLSDSGSVSEEAAILEFPAVTIRDSMERPEALDTAGILMSGTSVEDISNALLIRLSSKVNSQNLPEDYKVENTSERVAGFIASTHHVHEFWSGLRAE